MSDDDEFKIDLSDRLDKTKAKRKIVFPDETVIVFQKDNADVLQFINNKICKYIANRDFDALTKIKKYYISTGNNFFEIFARDVLHENTERENSAIESLKSKLKNKSEMNESDYKNIINKFINDFLLRDYIGAEAVNILESQLIEQVESKTDTVLCPENQSYSTGDAKRDASADYLAREKKAESEYIPLFGGAAIYKSMNNLLYADAKVGKSYFSIEVAKHMSIKKPLFILLEDYSDKQRRRYEENLKDIDYTLYILEDFNELYESEKRIREDEAEVETGKDAVIPFYNRHV